ncbi:phospho-N-acetylmuramoyl-pentapeptide-transferase [Candidatus Woesebacteria bacterium]|nr:phospho-N-acetylmuramoyl-pentapeptide-transferase [Candidatus Woesebacteria bacterium]QQG47132.1 MAG: phospho-N-acetylmuramoyl-pentapeptide-transferase [Candidatus Woesebacteria bacterium]
MNVPNILPLVLGLILFSFFVSSLLVVPFINLLYKIKLTRRREAMGKKKTLFEKLHDIKSGTPIGGGVLIIVIVVTLFAVLFPILLNFGVFIHSSFNLFKELLVIFFTFISFGLLGLLDDFVKTFGKPKTGNVGAVFGLTKKQKFSIQWVLALITAFILYQFLGIHILHLPLLNSVIDLGIFYVPFAATVIVFFANAFNFTDGLDGLASGLLVIYLISYIFISAGNLDTTLFMFISIWLGAIIAFLYFNVYPARVFLGDAGALSFGSTIALIGLLTGNVATLFVIGGIFVIEAASSAIQIISIKFFNKRVFPLAPIHHSFLAIGWEEPKIVMRAWIAGIILAIFGLWLAAI